jgi:hypothetical protein
MKELIAALGLVAIVAYFWMNPSVEAPPEPRASRRPVIAADATPANNSTSSPGSTGTAPKMDGSVAGRWTTGSNAQTNLTATVLDRWKTGPKAQTDLSATSPDRWKAGPK